MTALPTAGQAAAVIARLFCVLGLLGAPASAAAPAAAAAWGSPLPGAHPVVRPFIAPGSPWGPGHRGVDLLGQPGETVGSAGPGVVQFAGHVAGVPVVSVRHPDGLLTTYEPVRPVVRAGEPVRLGQTLGHLVRAGGHCPPRVCLHWGLRRGADYLDPLALLGLGTVRLLPLWPDGPRSPGWPLPAGGLAMGSAVVSRLMLRPRRLRLTGRGAR